MNFEPVRLRNCAAKFSLDGTVTSGSTTSIASYYWNIFFNGADPYLRLDAGIGLGFKGDHRFAARFALRDEVELAVVGAGASADHRS
jgi:hypothetical protein